MNIQQLEYIVALDTHRHFVAAAESCHVTQPTLTMQLQKLEEEVGVLLFDRSKKPMRPTAEGEAFISRARQILRDIHELKEIANEGKKSINGEFKLGIIPTVAPHLIPLFLDTFIKENPETILRIEEMESESLIKALHDDRIEMAIMATPIDEKDLKETTLYFEAFLLFAPEHHRLLKNELIETAQLDASNLLLLSEGHCFRNQALNLCSKNNGSAFHGFHYESGSIETLKSLVKKGMGYTLIPELSLKEDEKMCTRRFVKPEPVREISIVTHKSFNRQLLINKLKAAIQASLPEQIVTPKEFVKIKWR